MAGQPTTIPVLTALQLANRMAALFPNGWASQAAKSSGGLFYTVLETLGSQESFEQSGVAYALGSTRIQTATAPELDLASQDYFGDLLPRNSGESDASFSARLIANLFPAGATRPAIVNALTMLTGVAPRVIEPWNPGDTGAWDGPCYWDVDSQQNPARWGGSLPYQGFIITPPPPIDILNGNPLNTWDDGAYWDVPGYGFFEQAQNPVEQIYALLVRLHVEGTIIWVRIAQTVSIVPTPTPGVPFINDGGVLQLQSGAGYATSSAGLLPGSVWNNGLTVAIVHGITPNPFAPPVFFGSITELQLLSMGGGNLPLTAPTSGSGQIWNNGGEAAVA